MTSFVRRLSHLALGTALVSCTEPLPASFNGTFVLRTVGGEPVPTTITTESNYVVITDTIIFVADLSERGYRQLRHRAAYRNADGSALVAEYEEEYKRYGRHVVFVPPACLSSPNIDCSWPERRGVIEGDQFTITFSSPVLRELLLDRVR